MQQKSLGWQLWELFGPLLIKTGITFLVEMLIVTVYCLQRMPEILRTVATQEELYEKTMELSMDVLQYSVEITAIAAAVTIPVFVFMMKRDRIKEREMGLVPNKKAPILSYFLVGGISVAFALGMNNILLLSNLAEYSKAYQEASEALYAPSFPVQILCVGIVIPIMEELVFRGLIYRRMRRLVSPARAMLSSALFFGLYHGNLVQAIYGITSGLLLAYLYEKYGSMKAPILAHMLMNIVSCVLSAANVFWWMFEKASRVGVITVACAAIASTMFVLIRNIDEKPEVMVRSDEENNF